MNKPARYSIGTQVFHITKNKYGVVLDRWWDGLQWRYEVRHSGWYWTVPQHALETKEERAEFVWQARHAI